MKGLGVAGLRRELQTLTITHAIVAIAMSWMECLHIVNSVMVFSSLLTASIATLRSSKNRVQFWAIGKDCCDSLGDFHCDDSRKANANSGVAPPDPDSEP